MALIKKEIDLYFYYCSYEYLNSNELQNKYKKFAAYWTVCYALLMQNKHSQLIRAIQCHQKHIKTTVKTQIDAI